MDDVIYVAIILGFTLLAILFVIFCDHLIGSDDEAIAEESERIGVEAESDVDEVAA